MTENDGQGRRVAQTFDPHKAHDCEYCGHRFYDPTDTPGPQYMWEGHVIVECPEVPDEVRRWYNEPTYKSEP